MTRFSSLMIATSFAILPMTAFAQQQNPMPAQPTTSTETTHQAQVPDVKTQATTAKTTHAKLTAKPAVPAKTAEPGKS